MSVNGICHLDNLAHFNGIVNSDNIRAALNSRDDGGCRAPNPLLRLRHSGKLADEALPAGPNQPGEPLQARPRTQLVHVAQDLEVLRPRLGEAQPGVEDDAPPAHARGLGLGDAFEQLTGDGGDQAVRVVRQRVHGRGGAAHVHEADGAVAARHVGDHGRVELAGRDVVYDVRARGNGGLGDGGAVGVDADGEVGEFGEGADELDDGEDAGEFLVGGYFGAARGGGAAAHVDNGDTGSGEGFEGRDEVLGVVDAAIGEGVRGGVDDGHDVGLAAGCEGGEGRVRGGDGGEW